MALSYAQFSGTGSQKLFTFKFEYLSRTHVKASVNGVSVPFNWVGTYSVELNPAPALNSVVELRRSTPREKRLVRFTDGSTLVATDMNTSTLQSFFLAQEAFDQGAASMAVTEDGSFSALTRRITYLGDPVTDQDAVTKRWALSVANTNLTAAVAAKNEAVNAAGRSEAERAASQAARTGSETARAGSEAARDEARILRDSTSGHRLNAQNAQAGSETARDVSISKAAEATDQARLSGTERAASQAARVGAEAALAKTEAVAGGVIVPAGGIMPFATVNPPMGWLRCNGQAISRTDYPMLFAAIGTAWGEGNGTTTFNVPNLSDEFLRGASENRAVGSKQEDQLRAHGHTGTAAASGNHAHTASTDNQGNHQHTGNTSNYGHDHDGWTDVRGHHTHMMPEGGGSGTDGRFIQDSSNYHEATHAHTDGAGDHNHWFRTSWNDHSHSFTTAAAGGHTHNVTVNAGGAHTHNVTVDNTGGAETRPRNVAVLFCIKT